MLSSSGRACAGRRCTLLHAAERNGGKKVVSMSSSAVYGAPDDNPVDDQTPCHPGEDYGRAKLAAEELCWRAVARGLDVTVIRSRTIMGHGRLGIMQILFEWVREGGTSRCSVAATTSTNSSTPTISRPRRELDWAPRFGNAEMFAESYDWYLAHRDEVLGRTDPSHHRSAVKQGILVAVSEALRFAR